MTYPLSPNECLLISQTQNVLSWFFISFPSNSPTTTFHISINDNPIFPAAHPRNLGIILNISSISVNPTGSTFKIYPESYTSYQYCNYMPSLNQNLLFGHCKRLYGKLYHEPQFFTPLVVPFATMKHCRALKKKRCISLHLDVGMVTWFAVVNGILEKVTKKGLTPYL